MAISGDIADLPLTDLLNMIRFRGGIVSLTDTPRVGEMVIYFSPGFVTGFSIEKQNSDRNMKKRPNRPRRS